MRISKEKAVIAVLLALPVAIAAGDQILKRKAKRKLREGEERRIGRPPFTFILRRIENKGAALNLGDKKPAVIRFISVFVTAALTLLYIITLGRCGKGLLKAGMALLLGGAYSNTYDRLRDGYVTDYISAAGGPAWFRKIVFNIGDFCIAAGAALMVAGQ